MSSKSKDKDKFSDLIQQAASAITMASTDDLSDIENFESLFSEIEQCVQEISQLPGELKERTHGAVSSVTELVKGLLAQEVEDTDASLKVISETIITLQQLNEQIVKGVKAEDVSVDFPLVTKGADSDSDTASAQPETDVSEKADAETATAVANETESSSAEIPEVEPAVIADDDIELMVDFIAEASEHIESAEAGLLELESNPNDSEAINLIFRGFHTIKGMAGFLNLMELGSLAHSAENLLDLSRKGQLRLVGANMNVIFESLDMLKGMISELKVAVGGSRVIPSNPNLPQLLAKLKACLEGDPDQAQGLGSSTPAAGAKVSTEKSAGQAQSKQTSAKVKQTSDEKIKVSTLRLDNLVNMVGELVIAQSMVAQDVSVSLPPEHNLCRQVTHQGKMVRELQELSMMMRMVPIQGVFQKMARLVRDLSQKSGKKIDFVTEGEETELDRIVVDQIADPLVHMIRNSVDHGIESVEERAAAGKSPKGRVELRAFHQAGNIVIEIEDDGKGLDKDKILQKAISNGLVSSDQNLTDPEIFKLIFHAGLTTAAKVTEVSGRGVGMDVVRKNIESLRGKVEIDSTPGKGTTFTIRLPLTMAIIDGQVVRVGEHRYIVPIVSIVSCLRPKDKQISTVQGRGEMVSVQGNLISMVRLYKLFGVEPNSKVPSESSLVVVAEDGKKGCLMVDELLGQYQVVIKSLGEGIGKVKGISGGAIMGDGKISLIIDVPGLLEVARE